MRKDQSFDGNIYIAGKDDQDWKPMADNPTMKAVSVVGKAGGENGKH